jgi:hypothetical protein
VGPPDHPGDEGHDRGEDHSWHEPRRDEVRQTLNRGSTPLRLGNHLNDSRKHRIGADALRTHDDRSGSVHRTADNVGGGCLLHGHRFAGDHGLVDGGLALEHYPIDGYAFSGPNPQPIADVNLADRDFFVGGVVA